MPDAERLRRLKLCICQTDEDAIGQVLFREAEEAEAIADAEEAANALTEQSKEWELDREQTLP